MHWTGNFDEVQDFEGQIRRFAGGTGLMSDEDFNAGSRSQSLGDPKAGLSADLDALAAYLESLREFAPSPHRTVDGGLTPVAETGKALFQSRKCDQCHGGGALTDSINAAENPLHDIGTIRQPESGQRLNGPLIGFDTPSLRGIWNSAPYLHDGSATSLEEAVTAHRSEAAGGVLSDEELAALAAFLQQLDGRDP
jgi:cytochrome c peroxidase